MKRQITIFANTRLAPDQFLRYILRYGYGNVREKTLTQRRFDFSDATSVRCDRLCIRRVKSNSEACYVFALLYHLAESNWASVCVCRALT